MSYTRLGARDEPRAPRMLLAGLGRVVEVIGWAVLNAALLFAEQLAELLAPILLLAGAAWWALPRGLEALHLDGQPGDILQMVRAHVPVEIAIGSGYISAHALLVDGILCIGVVAICRTLTTLLANLLLERG